MQQRLTVIGDKKIISEFKKMCKKQGRFHSIVLVEWMAQYLSEWQQCRDAIKNRVTSGKKTKSV
jgi:hypothetical protein